MSDPMAKVVLSPIGHVDADTLVVLDASRRIYAGLSREGDYWHLIQPARLEDPRVGDGIRIAGQLVCSCPGGIYRGSCYYVRRAEALEGTTEADQGPTWLPREGLDDPAGAGDLVQASRG
jgi:hypothetical protein